ncbi:adenosylmethionine decarboxylase [Virgibacillus dakarensis]|uniref:S-adenosylmethionine decarboxylase proenzyme n=1 Tax=Lentibacillus populi TaxID=1827502 RepID=A0A9W5X7Q9_9BACI|nr:MULTISPECIES: adenosylmethionine decarboxylase [Bacillaceae]MBT2216859.1 adenosylmethionine decarboxylase [Virgibacillus dakarensis]MTW88109.1 adenosylmethionine decarboxylase [Virgibacillus dakarensis]GGB62570.1 S-adenosylmethionine decarboxylase proenzyme 1 [Lentibacillus populi]
MDTLGHHIVSDLWGCNVRKLINKTYLENELVSAAEKSGATVCGVFFHEFSPQGISGVVILAESHLSVHSFPEHGYASIDIYTCGRHVQPELAIQYLYSSLEAKYNNCRELVRGIKPENV